MSVRMRMRIRENVPQGQETKDVYRELIFLGVVVGEGGGYPSGFLSTSKIEISLLNYC